MTMAYVGIAVSIASLAVGTASAYTQSRTAKKVANRNQAIADMAAIDAQKRGEKDATKVRQEGSQATGAQRAAFAARGLDLQAGTPGDLLDQTEFFSQTDQTTTRNNAAKEAWNKRAQAEGYGLDSDSIGVGGNTFGAALGGASSVASKWYAYGGGGGSNTPSTSTFGMGNRSD